ncbi:hypothetical protein QKU48_gp0093 [Fadolivirus algeromassiliense]|jgi:hypothetical protein|uniref:Uncharacterized protein n=1 Tax=Fadolivirus FV1/VV64 TaxID=3070911 RepID=A0A7D3UTK3_9VIRU|nr:hypothetical protein QKU48_gp0093 [Fadolivirus algeromassiliense]QKF93551.1 hypothetical protein Fadolivirus_1_93 [Fadolivirus FV1/VV64]
MYNIIIISIILLILICIIYEIYFNKKIEGAGFNLDPLYIPDNPFPIDDVSSRRFFRIVGIDKHLKMDKYGRVEKITYKKPKPESGEISCHRVVCPSVYTNVACWTCS